MLISGVTTLIAHRRGDRRHRLSRFHTGEARPPAEVTALLPKGRASLATAVADDRIAVTLEMGGAIEIAPLTQDVAADRAAALCHRAVTYSVRPAGVCRRPEAGAPPRLHRPPVGSISDASQRLPSSSGPGRRPLTAKTGVRVP